MMYAEAEAIARDVMGGDISDDEIGYLIWNETGFPIFWDIPVDGTTPAECLRTQLACLRRARMESQDGSDAPPAP